MGIKFRSDAALRFARMCPASVKRFHTDEDGATAVEFAMIAFPFFLLIFAIIETSLFFFAGQYFETAVDDTMRLFRTGQLDDTATNQQFRDELCDRLTVMFVCGDIRTDVQVATRFQDLGSPPEPDPITGDFPPDGFPTGSDIGPEVIMQITASYKWPVYTNFSAPLAYESSGEFALLRVTAVTRTEPYSD